MSGWISFLGLLIIGAAAATVEVLRGRKAKKTCTYHVKIRFRSGKLERMTLDETQYKQFSQLLDSEQKRFYIGTDNARYTLFLDSIASVKMRKW